VKRLIATLALGSVLPASVVAHAEKEKITSIYWKKVFVHASDEYFDQVYFPYQPTLGTLAGYHQYDTQLEDLSQAKINAETAALKKFEKRLDDMHRKATFDQETRGDCEIVLGVIASRLLTLETIRFWEKNPDLYSSTASNGAFSIMERKFASPDDRLRSLVARERQMPGLLDNARINLKNPPRIYTEIAIEQLPDIIRFFEKDVPAAFSDANDAALKEEFAHTNAAVISALNSYLGWLKSDLMPRSNGDFRIGADTFSKKLAYDEMVDMPLDKLLEIGWADLRKNQEHFRHVAKELEPDKDPEAVLEELGRMHPAPDKLIPAFTATFDGLLEFIHGHAGSVREARHRGILQRDAARSIDDAGRSRRLHALLQHWDGDFDGGTRGVPGPLCAVPVGAAGAQPGAQTAGCHDQCGGLGALLRTDDARRGIWTARRRREG
jgi:hypothetical protein